MSHKFTIEIELADARYCDGCPYFVCVRLDTNYHSCTRFNLPVTYDSDGFARTSACIEAEKAQVPYDAIAMEKIATDVPRIEVAEVERIIIKLIEEYQKQSQELAAEFTGDGKPLAASYSAAHVCCCIELLNRIKAMKKGGE